MDVAEPFSGHYNPRNDVILRLEHINARQTKTVISMAWAGFFATQGLLWWEFGWKIQDVGPACIAVRTVLDNMDKQMCQAAES